MCAHGFASTWHSAGPWLGREYCRRYHTVLRCLEGGEKTQGNECNAGHCKIDWTTRWSSDGAVWGKRTLNRAHIHCEIDSDGFFVFCLLRECVMRGGDGGSAERSRRLTRAGTVIGRQTDPGRRHHGVDSLTWLQPSARVNGQWLLRLSSPSLHVNTKKKRRTIHRVDYLEVVRTSGSTSCLSQSYATKTTPRLSSIKWIHNGHRPMCNRW